MRIKTRGINIVSAQLASGEVKTYYYHRASGTRLAGAPGSHEFLVSLAAAEQSHRQRTAGTLAGLIREFEGTKQWRRLAKARKRNTGASFRFWDAEYGTCPYRALEDKKFRAEIIKWHDSFSEAKPREADNRVAILARILSWAAKDGPLLINVVDGFERAYRSDRSEIIWLPEHIEASSSEWRQQKCNSPWCWHFTPAKTGGRFAHGMEPVRRHLHHPSAGQGTTPRSNRSGHSRAMHQSIENDTRRGTAACHGHVDDENRPAVQKAIFR